MIERPPVKLTRATPIEFELPDGSVVTVQPPTIRQLRDAVALDPPDPPAGGDWIPETPDAALRRHVRQAKILCSLPLEDADTWIESLEPAGVNQVLQALTAHAHGYDPQVAVDIQELLKKKLALNEGRPSQDSTP